MLFCVLKATLKLGKEEGWRWVTISKIAKITGLEEIEIKKKYHSKIKILSNFSKNIDTTVINNIAKNDDDSPRDCLFDLLMARFDALLPYKSEIRSIVCEQVFEPKNFNLFLNDRINSMALILSAAGLSTSGLFGKLRIHGLLLIYTNAFRIWLLDDSPDFGKTMAVIDQDLHKAEFLMSFFSSLKK